MSKFHFTSMTHWIDESTPTYGNNEGFNRENLSSISEGRSSNSHKWHFNNHIGTHVDFPYHFYNEGKKSHHFDDVFKTEEFKIIDISKNNLEGKLISLELLLNDLNHCKPSLEVLIVKTGFEKYRGQKKYWCENPGFKPELAIFLKENFKDLKYFGFDSISLTSIVHRDIGATAHRAFLSEPNPILIIEDMKLDGLSEKIKYKYFYLTVAKIKSSDGVPVNCFFEH